MVVCVLPVNANHLATSLIRGAVCFKQSLLAAGAALQTDACVSRAT